MLPIILAFIIMSFIVITGIMQRQLNEYHHGFFIKGTYKEITSNPGDGEYFCFLGGKDNLIFYQYEQFGTPVKGEVLTTEQVNLYRLNVNNSPETFYHVLLDSDKLYLISKERVITLEKISDEATFINVEGPE